MLKIIIMLTVLVAPLVARHLRQYPYDPYPWYPPYEFEQYEPYEPYQYGPIPPYVLPQPEQPSPGKDQKHPALRPKMSSEEFDSMESELRYGLQHYRPFDRTNLYIRPPFSTVYTHPNIPPVETLPTHVPNEENNLQQEAESTKKSSQSHEIEIKPKESQRSTVSSHIIPVKLQKDLQQSTIPPLSIIPQKDLQESSISSEQSEPSSELIQLTEDPLQSSNSSESSFEPQDTQIQLEDAQQTTISSDISIQPQEDFEVTSQSSIFAISTEHSPIQSSEDIQQSSESLQSPSVNKLILVQPDDPQLSEAPDSPKLTKLIVQTESTLPLIQMKLEASLDVSSSDEISDEDKENISTEKSAIVESTESLIEPENKESLELNNCPPCPCLSKQSLS